MRTYRRFPEVLHVHGAVANSASKGEEISVTRDDRAGNVLLSSRPGAATWTEFFELLNETEVPDDFMRDRPMNKAPQGRDLFGDDA